MALIGLLKRKLPFWAAVSLKRKVFGAVERFPYAIQFNPSYKCNLKCSYCDCGIKKHENQELSTEEIFAMIDQYADLGTSRISFTGGEPLMRKDLPEMVNYARGKGLFVSVATNGTYVPKKLERLKGVNSFNLTLDGPEEIHDSQRGKGNFQSVLVAVRAIKEAGIPVYLNTVLTKNNAEKLEEVIEIAQKLGVKLLIQPVFFSEFSHANAEENVEEASSEKEIIIEALHWLIKRKEFKDPTLMLSKKYYQQVINYMHTGMKMKCQYASSGSLLYATISPEGNVTPCNLLVRRTDYLNGREQGFDQAFFQMPSHPCEGCISSFIDIDQFLFLDLAVAGNYLSHYFSLFSKHR